MPTYAGSKAQAGRGTQLSIGAVSPGGTGETFTLIGEVSDASITGTSWGTEDVTNFQSGADEEFITLTRNNGEVNITYNTVPNDAGQLALEVAYQSGLKYDFKLQAPVNTQAGQTTSGNIYAFSALVQSRDISYSVKSAIKGTVKLKISGAVTFTTGT